MKLIKVLLSLILIFVVLLVIISTVNLLASRRKLDSIYQPSAETPFGLQATQSGGEADNPAIINIAAISAPNREVEAYRNFIIKDLDKFLLNREIISAGLEKKTNIFTVDDLRDAYLIDADNDGEPELILVFEDAWERATYALIKNTASGMAVMDNIQLYAEGGGTMGRWYGQLRRGADGKIYSHEYQYFHTYDGGFQKSSESYVLKKHEHGEPETFIDIQFHDEVKYDELDIVEGNYQINGKSVNKKNFDEEITRIHTELERYEVIIDPSEGRYDLSEKIPFVYGMDFLKYVE